MLVTVYCVWLGYSLNWIRQRRDFIETIDRRTNASQPGYEYARSTAPMGLWLLGESGLSEVRVHKTDLKQGLPRGEFHQELADAKKLFPEAEIWVYFQTEAGYWEGQLEPR